MLLRAVVLLFCATLLVPMANAADEEESIIKQKPIYVSMLPHFLVNLSDAGGQRFLQIKANTLVANEDTEDTLKAHMPAVRHHILMKLSSLTSNDVRTSQKKEALIQDITDLIRVTLRESGGADDIKGFYITSLIIQ